MTSTDTAALRGRTVMITGAARGIGHACAAAFARAGSNLLLLDVDPDLAHHARSIATAGGECLTATADVRDDEQVAEAVDLGRERFGAIDVLVNNAGGMAGVAPTRTWELDLHSWDALLELNLRSVFICTRAVIPHMRLSPQRGCIVNVGAALGVRHASHLGAYGAAKAAVSHLTQTLAVELGHDGIRVNCVAPAFTLTPASEAFVDKSRRAASVRSIPLARVGRPDDIAGPVVFLASDMAAFMTGQTLHVDGGLTCTTQRTPRDWDEEGSA